MSEITFESSVEQDRRVMRQALNQAEQSVITKTAQLQVAEAMSGPLEHIVMWTSVHGVAMHSNRIGVKL
jgi:hypothetical protein